MKIIFKNYFYHTRVLRCAEARYGKVCSPQPPTPAPAWRAEYRALRRAAGAVNAPARRVALPAPSAARRRYELSELSALGHRAPRALPAAPAAPGGVSLPALHAPKTRRRRRFPARRRRSPASRRQPASKATRRRGGLRAGA